MPESDDPEDNNPANAGHEERHAEQEAAHVRVARHAVFDPAAHRSVRDSVIDGARRLICSRGVRPYREGPRRQRAGSGGDPQAADASRSVVMEQERTLSRCAPAGRATEPRLSPGTKRLCTPSPANSRSPATPPIERSCDGLPRFSITTEAGVARVRRTAPALRPLRERSSHQRRRSLVASSGSADRGPTRCRWWSKRSAPDRARAR